MTETILKLENLLNETEAYLLALSSTELKNKPDIKKWSKKEILGHLIDSGINNLQRFTEIQFETKPYKVREYNQNALVIANDYQNAEIKELLHFWMSLNKRIIALMKLQTEKTLNFKMFAKGNEQIDLRFLMEDYVNHLNHHTNQITAPTRYVN